MSKSEKAVAVRAQASPMAVLGAKYNIEPMRLAEVLRGTVIKPDRNGKQATNEEIAAFAIVAGQYDLNPFTKEIYAFTSGEKGVVPIVPIDGWTKIVNRHKNAEGELDYAGCEFEEKEDEKGNPISCTCVMHVKGRENPIKITERFSECKRNTSTWTQWPFRMLRHKAFIQAARYAFGLGGIHDEDEGRDIINVTDQATAGEARTPIAEPKALPFPEETQPEQQPEPPVENKTRWEDDAGNTIEEHTFTDYSCKDGVNQKTKKPWTKHEAKGNDGKLYGTFSETLGPDLQAAADGKTTCRVTFTENKFGRNILAIAVAGVIVDDGRDDAGAERAQA